MTWTFNQNELATWQQAQDLAAQIEAFRASSGVNMGGGVLPITKDPNTSGIFVPSWDGGPGGFPEPNDAPHAKFWLHYRYRNGRVTNVGLILDKLVRYNGAEWPVFSSINSNDLS